MQDFSLMLSNRERQWVTMPHAPALERRTRDWTAQICGGWMDRAVTIGVGLRPMTKSLFCRFCIVTLWPARPRQGLLSRRKQAHVAISGESECYQQHS